MCYTVPVATAVITTIIWKRTQSAKVWWLNLMLYGAAVFGVIDHLWNGELFLISKDLGKDLLLGFTITAAVFVVWAGVVIIGRAQTRRYSNQS